MKKLIALLLLFGIAGCGSSRTDLWDPRGDLPENVETPRGNFVFYELLSDTVYRVGWGNKHFKRTLPDERLGAPSWVPRYREENANYLVLEAGCGAPCWYALVLPLDDTSEVRHRGYPMAYDTEHNLIAYIGRGDSMLVVENIHTQRIVNVVHADCQISAAPTFCIDSVQFVDGAVSYRRITDANDTRVRELVNIPR